MRKLILIGVCIIALFGSGLSFKRASNYAEDVVDEVIGESVEIDDLNDVEEDKDTEINSESIQDTYNKEITSKGTANSTSNATTKSSNETSKKDVSSNVSSNNFSSSKTETENTNEEISSVKEEQTKTEEVKKEETQNNIVSTTFYDSITHGKKEFKSEAEAIVRGDSIVDNELNYVLDYNEMHPDNQIQPTINYYRIYPSVIDENGQYWYYLHFFTTNGEGQDDILKSKF